MHVFYSDHHEFPLPKDHRFPIAKYRMTRERLLAQQVLREDELFPSSPVSLALVARAHDAQYVQEVVSGTVEPKSWRRVGFPWSKELVTRSLAAVGGTVSAATEALRHGFAGNLAGGTHHAHKDRGEGYCIFNDIAVAAVDLLARRTVSRVAVVDLDVHQGNGNSSMLGSDERVFVFSMHGAKNYPLHKIPSTLDLELQDGAGDEVYLSLLAEHFDRVLRFRPEIVFYQAGVDGLKEDRLGRLSLTHEGLLQRDLYVLQRCREAGIPVCVSMGGGYAVPIERTVEACVNTYVAAKELFD